jgi:hypothetical protein
MITAALPVASIVLAFNAPLQQPPRDFAKIDACQVVPGDVVARAIGGKLVSTAPTAAKSFSRCRYTILPAGGATPAGYLVWLQAASDFDELKSLADKPVSELTGLGDSAFLFRDDDGRFKIDVVKRGDLMFQATGATAESARKVADAVASHLWASKTPKKQALR